MRRFLCFLLCSPAALLAADLVRDGAPVSEIIISKEALPQVQFAAKELQEHLRKISGATVPIVHAPSEGGGVFPIYVGEQPQTKALGVSLDAVPMEGYRVVANDKALVLAGRDARFKPVPEGFHATSDVPRLTEEWRKFTGQNWMLPRNGLYDPRNHSEQLDFSVYDPTGTLFAVYDLLEQLGVRWYYPDTATGTILPEQKTVTVADQDHSAAPVFSHRFMRWTFPSADPEGFLWFKRQKLGMSEMTWLCHGTSIVTSQTWKTHPEYSAKVNGEIVLSHSKGRTKPQSPRLGPPLRDAMVEFADKFFEWAPEVNTFSAAPSDGFVKLDDRDASWDRPERGPSGRFSDYIWTFVNDVAKGVAKKHPDKIVIGLAYSQGRAVPQGIDKLEPNVGVVYCQTRGQQMRDPAEREAMRKERNDWIAKMGNKEFYIWEYYLYHSEHRQLPGVPVVFTRVMQEDAQDLRGKSKGEYVECSYGREVMANPALNHYPYMVQARLYWNPDLDLPAFLDEYCRKFYGPAAEEMKTFLTYAEEVWMQPGGRMAADKDFFLKEANVTRLFEILEAAKAKAGDGIYGQRVAAMAAECEPMRGIFGSKDAYSTGVAAAKAGDGETAIRDLKAAVAEATEPAARLDARIALAQVYRDQLGDNAAAIDTLKAALADQGRVAVPWRQKQRQARLDCIALLRKEQRFEEARDLLAAMDPEKLSGYWKFVVLKLSGEIARDLGDEATAHDRFVAALEVTNVPDSMVESLRKQLNR